MLSRPGFLLSSANAPANVKFVRLAGNHRP